MIEDLIHSQPQPVPVELPYVIRPTWEGGTARVWRAVARGEWEGFTPQFLIIRSVGKRWWFVEPPIAGVMHSTERVEFYSGIHNGPRHMSEPQQARVKSLSDEWAEEIQRTGLWDARFPTRRDAHLALCELIPPERLGRRVSG